MDEEITTTTTQEVPQDAVQAPTTAVDPNVVPVEALEQNQAPLDLPSGQEIAQNKAVTRDSLLAQSDAALVGQQQALQGQVAKQTDVEGKVLEGMFGLAGEGAFRQEERAARNLPELEQALGQMNVAITQNARRGAAAMAQTMSDALGTGLTKGSLRVRLDNTQLENAIQSQLMAADSAALQGSVQTANQLVDSAVAAKFEPMKAELEIRKFQLGRLDDSVQRGDIKLDKAQQQKFNLQMGQVVKQEQDLEVAQELAQNVLKNGAPESMKKAALNATSRKELLEIPGIERYLMSQGERMDLSIKASKLAKATGSGSDASEQVASILGNIDKMLKNSKGGKAVGSSSRRRARREGKGRSTFKAGTKKQDFAGQYDQLKAALTVDNLDLLTGTISDADLKLLSDLGTSLSLDNSDESFLAELGKIQDGFSRGMGTDTPTMLKSLDIFTTTKGGFNQTEVIPEKTVAEETVDAIAVAQAGGATDEESVDLVIAEYPEAQETINILLEQGYSYEQVLGDLPSIINF